MLYKMFQSIIKRYFNLLKYISDKFTLKNWLNVVLQVRQKCAIKTSFVHLMPFAIYELHIYINNKCVCNGTAAEHLISAILFCFVTQINLFLTYIYLFSRVFFCFCYHVIFFSLLASLTSFSSQF